MSSIVIALGPFVMVAVVFVVARLVANKSAPAAQQADPTSGKCGYIIRGIAGFTCPECGSDLREVGIVAPGLRKPLGTAARLALWTAVAVAPAMIFGSVGASYLAPWQATSTRNRFIFIQSPTVTQTIEVRQEGGQRVIGRPAYNHPVPLQKMTLSLRSGPQTIDDMRVDLASRAAQFMDPTRKVAVTGTLDAAFSAAWLNANGITDATVPQRAADVLAAIDDMNNNGGKGFRNFSPNPARSNLPDVIAHPA